MKFMPKIELHCHLDGSLRPETVYKWLEEMNELGSYDSVKAVAEDLIAPVDCDSLDTYLKRFALPVKTLQTEANLKKAAFEVMADAALENVKYLEIRFAPELHTQRGLSYEAIIGAVVSGIREAESIHDIKGNVILSHMRFSSEADLIKLIDAGLPFLRKGVVAVDLCASEHEGFAKKFVQGMTYARSLGYDVSIHAGETGFVQNIVDAVEMLGATRIGHGVAMWNHPEVQALVKSKNVTVECCPTSNLQTKAISEATAHPMDAYLNSGLKVSMNTDNRTVSDTTMTGEFRLMQETFSWTMDQMRQIYLDSLEASFADEATKAWLREKI